MPVFFSVLLCRLKSRVTEICLNPAKRNLFRPRGDILPGPRVVGYRPRLSCDGFESRCNRSVRRQNSSALQGRWLEEPEGVPTTYRPAKGTKRPYGRRRETKRSLRPRKENKNGHYGHVGVRPPPPLWGSSPCEAGQFIPGGFDCRHSEVCKNRYSVSLNSLNSFFQMVLNPQGCGLFP